MSGERRFVIFFDLLVVTWQVIFDLLVVIWQKKLCIKQVDSSGLREEKLIYVHVNYILCCVATMVEEIHLWLGGQELA